MFGEFSIEQLEYITDPETLESQVGMSRQQRIYAILKHSLFKNYKGKFYPDKITDIYEYFQAEPIYQVENPKTRRRKMVESQISAKVHEKAQRVSEKVQQKAERKKKEEVRRAEAV